MNIDAARGTGTGTGTGTDATDTPEAGEPFHAYLDGVTADTWEAIYALPFLAKLAAGSLELPRFAFFISQDIQYLDTFAGVLRRAAPLAEELFFRGLVYRALSEIWSPTLAIFVSGFLFGAFHLNLSVLIPFTILGMLLAWGFRASGSIWVPIAAHFTINSVSFTVTVIGVFN